MSIGESLTMPHFLKRLFADIDALIWRMTAGA
jgi:hypothetical protein